MSEQNISLEYVNSIVYDLQKAFWDERGKGARFRVTNVGRDFFLKKCLPRIKSQDVEIIVGTIEQILKEEGIVSSISHEWEDRLLRLQMQGYLHAEADQKLIDKGVEPFTCIPANLVVLAIEEVLDRPAELAEVKIEDGTWHVLIVLFDSRPTFEE